MNIARLLLAAAGAGAIVWATTAVQAFRHERAIVGVGTAVASGEIYKPDTVAAVDARTHDGASARLRASVLGKVAYIRLRIVEDTLRSGNPANLDRSFEALSSAIDAALRSAPNEPYLWLVRFWLDSARKGLHPDHFRFLRTSYVLGRYEGWVSVRRNRFALAAYSALPEDIAKLAINEFGGLVRWGLTSEAAELASGPGRPVREALYEGLKSMRRDRLQPFAREMSQRELDDIAVPGFEGRKPSWR